MGNFKLLVLVERFHEKLEAPLLFRLHGQTSQNFLNIN